MTGQAPWFDGHITVGLFAKQVLEGRRCEAIGQTLVLEAVLAPAGNQLAIANQADRAKTLDREPLGSVCDGLAIGPRRGRG